MQALQEAIHLIVNNLQQESERTNHTVPDEKIALHQHVDIILEFYGLMLRHKQIVSDETCVFCFMEAGEHVLPCGHVLCTQCIKVLGSSKSKTEYSLKSCPLHVGKHNGPFDVPHIIRFKPDFAGTRILSLDG